MTLVFPVPRTAKTATTGTRCGGSFPLSAPDLAVLSFNLVKERSSKQPLISWEGRLMASFALGTKSYSKHSVSCWKRILSIRDTFSQTHYNCRWHLGMALWKSTAFNTSLKSLLQNVFFYDFHFSNKSNLYLLKEIWTQWQKILIVWFICM